MPRSMPCVTSGWPRPTSRSQSMAVRPRWAAVRRALARTDSETSEEIPMLTRRQFLRDAGTTALGASLVSKLQAALLPEAPLQTVAATQPPLVPPNGRPYNPVVTLNGWTLPRGVTNGVQEFR